MNKNTIVVTGATGFIGLRLLKKLVKKYQASDITCLVWNKNSVMEKRGRRELGKLKVKIQKIDLSTGYGLKNIPKSPKIVIHLASTTDTANSDFSCNDTGTANLIKALKLNKNSHFFYTSTTASMSGRKNCTKPVQESTRPFPTNEYGRTKYNAEKILLKASKKLGFATTIVRMPTVYGRCSRKNNFFEIINKLVDFHSFLSKLNWQGLTSFIYVEDVADAILMLVKKKPRASGSHLFILSAESLTLSNIFSLIYKAKGLPYRQIILPPFFWKLTKKIRPAIYFFEKLLPAKIYNQFWRAALIFDNVINCDATRIKRFLPSWKPKNLAEVINEVT
jgi:nucleoside-diphosphate-sugar epimerase